MFAGSTWWYPHRSLHRTHHPQPNTFPGGPHARGRQRSRLVNNDAQAGTTRRGDEDQCKASTGLSMPDTKLLIFGSPAGGTPIMLAAPLAALDLPLKVLVWEDPAGGSFVSYVDPAYLAARHQLTDDLTARIAGINTITDAAVAP